MKKPITGAMAEALRANRDRFNAKYAHARRIMPSLDAETFSDFLRHKIAPVADAVAKEKPARISDAVEVLFDISLELFGKDHAARHPVVVEGWLRLLQGVPRLFASAPGKFAGAMANALSNLCATDGARPEEWIAWMLRVADQCSDIETFLDAGKIASWRSGMAHYRESALEICVKVPAGISSEFLALFPGAAPADVEEAVKALLRDPWIHPGAASNGKKTLRIMSRVGAFRGFGGNFITPPKVLSEDDGFLVFEDGQLWRLYADRFGALLQREVSSTAEKSNGKKTFTIDRHGHVRCGRHDAYFPELVNPSSWAANDTTLAVTVPYSHTVCLVALCGELSDAVE